MLKTAETLNPIYPIYLKTPLVQVVHKTPRHVDAAEGFGLRRRRFGSSLGSVMNGHQRAQFMGGRGGSGLGFRGLVFMGFLA